MRDLNPWAKRSRGRDRHRAFYAAYMASPAWFRRREEWALTETARLAPAPIVCRGGCGAEWDVDRDDLHHCDYERLGHEAHEDLWPMCRSCHTRLHELMDSSRSWRRLSRRHANELAIATVIAEHQVGRRGAASNLRDYL